VRIEAGGDIGEDEALCVASDIICWLRTMHKKYAVADLPDTPDGEWAE